jgi:predicted nucleic acid-binding protein
LKAIDSSVWLEYFAAGPLAGKIEPELANRDRLVTPAVVVYEVYRWLLAHRGEEDAAFAAALLQQTRVVPLDETLARQAAEIAVDRKLAMADALIYATAQAHDATLVTMDADFADLPGVEYHAKS